MNSYFDKFIILVNKSTNYREVVLKFERSYLLMNSENREDLTFIGFNEATPSEVAETASLEFENANYHDLVTMPLILLRALQNQSLSDSDSKAILDDVCGTMLQDI